VKRLALLALILPALLWTIPAQAATQCWGKNPTKVGTPGNDVIFGTDRADVIAGLGGHDIIKGRGGADLLCGGDNDDEVYGDKGADKVGGDNNNDSVFGGAGNDRLNGGSSFEGDIFDGGPGDDVMTASSHWDFVTYANATGRVNVNLESSRARGQGTDTLRFFQSVIGSQFADSITGAPEDWMDLELHGLGGKDRIDTNDAGFSLVYGGEGNDTLLGRSGVDELQGGTGDDFIRDNGQSHDWLRGDYGSDSLDATDRSEVSDDVNGGPDAGGGPDLCYGDDADVFTNCSNL
jgi:Ca2+-binding RTX toxin-like protein